MINLLIYIICFCLFVILQAYVINGVHYCFKYTIHKKVETNETYIEGNIFYKVSLWFNKRENRICKFLSKPLFNCIRCMASIWGTITFWVAVIPIIGFYPQEIIVWLFDILILVSLNWQIYKKM